MCVSVHALVCWGEREGMRRMAQVCEAEGQLPRRTATGARGSCREGGGRSWPVAAAVRARAPVSTGCSGKPLGGFKHCRAALRFTKIPSAAWQRKDFGPLPGAAATRPHRKHPPHTSRSWKSEFQVWARCFLLRPPRRVDGHVSPRGHSSVRVCPHLL